MFSTTENGDGGGLRFVRQVRQRGEDRRIGGMIAMIGQDAECGW